VAVADTGAPEEPGLAAGIEFALPTGHAMELVVQSHPRGFITSAEAPPAHHRATGPAPLEHITLMAADIRANSEFLVERLGFRVTDSWQPADGEPWRNTWLRAGELHHDLAMLVANGAEPELHHFCFAVPSVIDLVRVADALAARGMAVDASMGRHSAGNNVFLYFKDPFGNRVEVNTDMARVDPAAPSRILRQPAAFDAWREGRPPALASGSPCRDSRERPGGAA
jgi:catechol 2,3-dioxygenase